MVTLRALVAIMTLPALAAGCFHPTFREAIACDTNGACPDGLRCGPDQICGSTGATDDAQNPGDGGGGAVTDAATCFGAGLVRVCLAAAPAAALTISGPGRTIDTGDATTCAATVSGGDGYCVVAATTIAVNAVLRATGPRPLVLIASDAITVTQLIDVASHRTNPEFVGAGADPTQLCGAGAAAGAGGGGAGGSFTGTGGAGGAVATLGGGPGGAPAAAVTMVNQLRGGCSGQTGGASGTQGPGGHGGGAVYLIAGNRIELSGPGIDAGGEGGGAGGAGSPGALSGGAGGGGSGGMIGLDAPVITSSAALIANGGAGGEGGGNLGSGTPGADATTIAAALGGSGGTLTGGDGGNGSAGVAAGAGASGRDSSGMGGNGSGGGGGGGGGAGIIKGPPAALGAQVSPAATP